MTPPITEAVRDVLSQGRPGEAAAIIQQLDPAAAAEVLAALPFEEQQMLFRLLPVDFAAAAVSHFPYYHAYVLLHSRPLAEMRAIVDKLDPTERMRFFDELPEEAWQRLMDELAGAPAEAPKPAVVVPTSPLRRWRRSSRRGKSRKASGNRTGGKSRLSRRWICVWNPMPLSRSAVLQVAANLRCCASSQASQRHPAA